MGKVERYRRYAAECIRLAQQTLDSEEKETLLGMAQAWCRLAEHAVKESKLDTGETSK
jgi:hypothetical protein